MACDTFDDFTDLAKYRQSFMGDLQIAKSKAIKLVMLEAFEFKSEKGFAMVLGAVPTAMMDQLKKKAGKVKASGALALVDGVLKVTVKSGKLVDSDMKKALELARVKREFTIAAVGEEREADETEDEDLPSGEPVLPPKLKGAGEAFITAQNQLVEFFKVRYEAMQWHEGQIKTQQDATNKIAEIEKGVADLRLSIAAAEKKKADLGKELKQLTKDEVTKFAKGGLVRLQKAITDQEKLVTKLTNDIAKLERGLPDLKVLAAKHGSSRHGAQTDVSLQARRAATGGITPDQRDNVHGVSESRVDDQGNALVEVTWNSSVKIKLNKKKGAQDVLNGADIHKALITEVSKLDKVDTNTASKFHSHELEREAVERATAKVTKECIWSEILEGTEWKPLDTVTVYVGPPRKGPGWGFSYVRPAEIAKTAVDAANVAIERYRKGGTQEQLLKDLNVVMTTVKESDKQGKQIDSQVPMVKTCRVTLKRVGKGWTSITHFPDPTATPAGWSLSGQAVRLNAKGPKLTVPGGATP